MEQQEQAAASGRRSLSVLTKMIMSAALLVAVVVAAVGALDLMAMLKVYDETTRRQQELGEAAIRREGKSVARRLAVSLAPSVTEANYSLLEEVLEANTKGDKLLLYALVADSEGTVLQSSGQGTLPKKISLEAKSGTPPKPRQVRVGGERALLFIEPIKYADKVRGELWIAYSLAELDQQIAKLREQREKATHKAIIRSALVGGLCLLLGLLLSIGQGLQVTRPVRQLAQKATAIAVGDLSARVDVKSRDEFGHLGATFNHMAERIQVLLKETADKITLQNEMEVARNVQDRLVASPELVKRGALTLAGYYQPASICGGDFWNYFDMGDNKIMVVVGDVTGHGVPSAMLTATAKACCDTVQATYGGNITVPQLMKTLNVVIYQAAKRHMQMTCFITLIDLNKRTMMFASAGHPMPYLCRSKEGKYRLQTLIARGNRLGDLLEWDFPAYTMELQQGDVLIWFTDGITEGESPEGVEWGEKRLRRALQPNAHRPLDELRDSVIKAAFDFYRNRPPEDDITLVLGRID